MYTFEMPKRMCVILHRRAIKTVDLIWDPGSFPSTSAVYPHRNHSSRNFCMKKETFLPFINKHTNYTRR